MFSNFFFYAKIILGESMKNIELKNCPNCNSRIGIHDTECPYCKYIDDIKYQKHNKKLAQKKGKKKNSIYSLILFIPILFYLIHLLFKINSLVIILPLILLNIMCLFVKKENIIWVILVEIIYLIFNLIKSITTIKIFNNLIIEIILFLLGIIFIIIPKFIYLIKTKKKKRKNNKKKASIRN